jgi:hypothetical protein
MIDGSLKKLSDTLLYEGYSLYPYRKSALKNQFRWNFGVLYPASYVDQTQTYSSDKAKFVTECLFEFERSRPTFHCILRFFRQDKEQRDSAEKLTLTDISENHVELIESAHLSGKIEFEVIPLNDTVARLSVRLENMVCDKMVFKTRQEALIYSFLSTHLIIQAQGASFVSMTSYPDVYEQFVANCYNDGLWPALVGERDNRNCVLAAPIILEDFPKISDFSPARMCDATEIDEMLALRLLTLSGSEKQEIKSDAHSAGLLKSIECLTNEQLLSLHGRSEQYPLKKGTKVVIHPKRTADAIDMLLDGRKGTVSTLEEDFDGNKYVTVCFDDDPGKDFGEQGKHGHRFFFSLTEVEPVGE